MKKIFLTQEELTLLGDFKNTSSNIRVRMRSEALLLLNKGFDFNIIAEIVDAHPATIRRTQNNWLKNKIDSLFDAPRSGAPSILSLAEQMQIITMANEFPSSAQNLCNEFEKLTSKKIGKYVVINLLKKRN